MREITLFHTEQLQLSPDLTVVWFWEDLTPQNPYYIKGTDPNLPHTGLYQNGVLISTVQWHKSTVTLEMVESFLDNVEYHQLRPGWSPVPEVL